MTVQPDLERMVDEVLEPIWRRERRRARLRRLADPLLRLAVLLSFVSLMAVVFGPGPAGPALVFFTLLGACCIFSNDARQGPGRRRNRTRMAGA
jgi:peptidoglycan/LPS O-acetylase OafA/YrhL